MKATIGSVGELFGLLQLVGETSMIDLIGPMRILRGDTATYRITVTDDDDARVDLDGAAIELQVKPTLGAADPPTISKLVGSGITILDQLVADTKGQADVAISSVDSSTPAAGLYWLDVVVVLAGARVHVVAPREYTIGETVNIP
jgi:hypothetical protein